METTKKRISKAGFDIDSPELQAGKKEILEIIRKQWYEFKWNSGVYKHLMYIMSFCLILTLYTTLSFGFHHWGYIVLHSVLFLGALTSFIIAGFYYSKKYMSHSVLAFFVFCYITGYMEEGTDTDTQMVQILQLIEDQRHWYQIIL